MTPAARRLKEAWQAAIQKQTTYEDEAQARVQDLRLQLRTKLGGASVTVSGPEHHDGGLLSYVLIVRLDEGMESVVPLLVRGEGMTWTARVGEVGVSLGEAFDVGDPSAAADKVIDLMADGLGAAFDSWHTGGQPRAIGFGSVR